jgi:hypothetical protein
MIQGLFFSLERELLIVFVQVKTTSLAASRSDSVPQCLVSRLVIF